LNETPVNVTDGVPTGGRLVQAIRFADDQAMTASFEESLQRIMEALERISEEYGMRIYLKKTKSNDVYQRSTKEYQSGFETLNWNRFMNSILGKFSCRRCS